MAGEVFTYTLTVTNTTGGENIVLIEDRLPAGASVVNLGSATFSNGVLQWARTITTTPIFLTFSVMATQTGGIVNRYYTATSASLMGTGAPVNISVTPGTPAVVGIVASPNPNIVSGTTALTMTVTDFYGNAVADGTIVSLDFDLGTLDGQSPGTPVTGTTSGGQVVMTLAGDTVAGTTHLTATAGSVVQFTQVVFDPGPPNALAVIISPPSIPSDGLTTANITATVTDLYGNMVAQTPVTLSTDLGDINGSGPSVVVPTGGGTAVATLAGTLAGTATVTAAVAALPPQTATVYIVPGPPTRLSIQANPTSIQADGVSTSTITLLIFDVNDNLVDAPVLVTTTTALGTLTGGGATYTETTTAGEVAVTLTSSTTAGTANIYALAAGLNTAIAVDFIPGAPSQIDLALSPAAIAADGVTTATITATVRDAFNNPVDTPVGVTFAAGSGTFLPDDNGTTVNGVIVRNLQSSITLGTFPITATAAGVGTPAGGSIDFVVGPPSDADVSLNPTSPVTVGVPISLTLTIRDGVGHLIPNTPLTVTSFLGSILPSATGLTDGSGQLERTLISTQVGADIIGVFDAGGPLAVSGGSVLFTPDAPLEAILSADPGELFADGNTTSEISAQLLDQYGNPTPAISPNFITTLGTIIGSTTTDAAGLVTRTLRSSTALGTAVISITGLLSVTTTSVDFVAGPPFTATLSAGPTTALVGQNVSLAITVTDSVGHPLAGQVLAVNSSFGTVSGCSATDAQGMLTCTLFSTQSGNPQIDVAGLPTVGDTITYIPDALDHVEVIPTGSLLAPLDILTGVPLDFDAIGYDRYNNPIADPGFSWNVSAFGGDGNVDANGIFVGTRVGLVAVTANSSGHSGVSFAQIAAGSPAMATITADRLIVPADGVETANLTIQVQDAYGNDAGFGVPLTVIASLGIVQGSTSTDADGIAYRTVRSTQAGEAIIDITNLMTVTGDTVITFTPGTPSQASVSASLNPIPANGVAQSTLTITLRDSFGNPIGAGFYPTVQTSLGTISGSGATDASGIIIRTLTAPPVEGAANLTVKYQGVPLIVSGDPITFVVGALDHVEITPAGPLSIPAGLPLLFTAQGYDVDNALLPANRVDYSWFLNFTASGEGMRNPLLGPQTTFSGTIAGTGVQLISWAIEEGNLETNYVDITVLPGPPTLAAVSTNPASVTADDTSPITVTLSGLVDPYGNQAVDGTVITVTAQAQPQARTSVASSLSGQAVVTIPATTKAGTYPLVASSAGGQMTLTGDPSLTFTPGPPAQAEVISPDPPQVVADGVSTGTVALQVRDVYGNKVAGGLSLVVTTTLGTILPGGGPTDNNGVLTRTLQSSLTLGEATLSVAGFAASGPTISFVPGPPTSAAVTVISPTLAAGGESVIVTFDVRDAWNHPVAEGTVITPTLTPARGTFGGNMQTTGGLATPTLSSGTTVGTATIGSQGLAVGGDTLITFVPGSAAVASITAAPVTRLVGGSTALDLVVTDAYSNIVPPTAIAITAPGDTLDGSGATVTKTTAAGTGLISLSLFSTIAETKTLLMQGPAGPLTVHPASDAVVFLPGSPVIVTVDAGSPLTVSAGSPLQVTVSSRDIYGNAIDLWTAVDYTWWQNSSVGGAGYGSLTPLDSHGRTIEFMPMYVGPNQLWTTGGITGSNILDLSVVAGPPLVAGIAVNPASVPADGLSTYTISLANITDIYGNPIPDGVPLTVTVQASPPVETLATTLGQALTTVLTSTTQAGLHPLVVEGESGPLSLSGDTTVTFLPGPPVRASIDAAPETLPADGASASSLTVAVYDNFLNLVSNGIPITVTSSLGTVTGSGDTLNGVVDRTLRAPVALGTASFTVEGPDGALFVVGDTVEFVPGDPAQAWVEARPAQVLADGLSTSQITVTIQDAHGFNTGGSGTALLSVGRGSILPATATATGGTFTATFSGDTSPGPADLAVTYEGDSLTMAGDLLELVPGSAVAATISASPDSLQIGSGGQSVLTVNLFDAWGHPVADGTAVTVTTSLGGIVSNAGATVNGVVTRVLTPGLTQGTTVFTVETWPGTGPLSPSGDTVEILPGGLHHIDITPETVTEVTAGQSVTFTAIGRDSFGNETGTGLFDWRLLLGSGYGILAGDGVFTGTIAGAVGIQASQGTLFSPIKSVAVIPGPPITAVVNVSPISIPVGGSTADLTITLRDAYGNRAADGISVEVTTNLGTLLGSTSTKDGIVTRTLVSGSYYGTADIFVDGWEAAGDKPAFVPVGQVTANPATLIADGKSRTVLTIKVFGPTGQPVPDGTYPTITTTLGTLIDQGSGLFGGDGTVDGVLIRILEAPLTPGTAQIYVNGTLALGEVIFTVGAPAVAYISADPSSLMADGEDTATLALTAQDDYGHVITTAGPLTVTTTLGTIGDVVPVINGVTTRLLTAGTETGVAEISVAGLSVAGDWRIPFVGELVSGDFEGDDLETWMVGSVVYSTESALVYTATRLSGDQVGNIIVTPVSNQWMMRLGATTADNTGHGVSEVWLSQPVYVRSGGVTQLTFSYRLLSYDVAVGSGALGYLEWDPFEVYINGIEVLQDGFPWTPAWQTWYGPPPPPSPKDMDWKVGVLDLSPYAGQVATIEFRVPNRQAAIDNTWVYLDDIQMKYVKENKVFLPLVVR